MRTVPLPPGVKPSCS